MKISRLKTLLVAALVQRTASAGDFTIFAGLECVSSTPVVELRS